MRRTLTASIIVSCTALALTIVGIAAVLSSNGMSQAGEVDENDIRVIAQRFDEFGNLVSTLDSDQDEHLAVNTSVEENGDIKIVPDVLGGNEKSDISEIHLYIKEDNEYHKINMDAEAKGNNERAVILPSEYADEDVAVVYVYGARNDTSAYLDVTGTRYHYGGYSTAQMVVNGFDAYCANPSKATPSTGTYTRSEIAPGCGIVNSSRVQELKADLWFSIGNSGFERDMWPAGVTDEELHAFAHVLISDTYSSDGNWALYGCTQEYKDWVRYNIIGFDANGNLINDNAVGRIINRRSNEVPSTFEAFVLHTGSSTQDIVGCYYNPYGWVEVNKVSEDPGITNNNPAFSLAGAVYGVYNNDQFIAENGGLVATLTTDENGYGKTDSVIPHGNYWIKEITPSKGFKLDPTEHNAVRIIGLAGTTINSTEPLGIGYVELDKDSTNPKSETERYSFEGIKYELTSNANASERYTVTLDSDGYALFKDIPYGDYTLTEIETNQYYVLDATPHQVTINAESEAKIFAGVLMPAVKVEPKDEPELGRLEIEKTSTDPDALKNPYYTFEGIEYTAVGKTSGDTYVFTLDADGKASRENVLFDEYTVTETKTNKWYELDATPQTKTLDANSSKADYNGILVPTERFSFSDKPVYVEFDLNKQSANTSISGNNKQYDISGAEYTITNTRLGQQSDKIVTDTSGKAKSNVKLLVDDYMIKETLGANCGFAIDPLEYRYSGSELIAFAGGSKHVTRASGDELSDEPQYDISLKINKKSSRSDSNYSAGKASLKDAVYKVEYWDVKSADEKGTATPEHHRTWYIRTDEHGQADMSSASTGTFSVTTTRSNGRQITRTFTSDALYVGHDGKNVIPLGYVEVSEVSNPVGYFFDNGTSEGPGEITSKRIDGNRSTEEFEFEIVSTKDSEELEYRGDFDFSKLEMNTQMRMPFIPFMITSATTGESHVIVTDENGYASTESAFNPHTDSTNANDAAFEKNADGEWILVQESALDSYAGIWFTGYGPNSEQGSQDFAANVMPDDNARALPYDTYEVRELPCSSNEGYALVKFTVNVSRDNYKVPGGTINDPEITISTTATDQATGGHVGDPTAESVIIKDEVRYTNLTPGDKYTLTATLLDKETGEPVLLEDGSEVVSSYQFVADEAFGTETVTFDVPGSVLLGKRTVVFEELRDVQRVVATHADIDDDGQTVDFPGIHTTATDEATGEHEGASTREVVTIVDVVDYEGLVPRQRYTITGALMDKKSGDALRDENGQKFTATVTFEPEEASGSIELQYEIPSKIVASKTVVVFEDLYYQDKLICSHADIDDLGQSVNYPLIHTTATDDITCTHVGFANGTVKVDDVVKYENLLAGETYTMEGTLMDADTSKPIFGGDGQPVMARTEFVAGKDSHVDEYQSVIDSYIEYAEKMIPIYTDQPVVDDPLWDWALDQETLAQMKGTLDDISSGGGLPALSGEIGIWASYKPHLPEQYAGDFENMPDAADVMNAAFALRAYNIFSKMTQEEYDAYIEEFSKSSEFIENLLTKLSAANLPDDAYEYTDDIGNVYTLISLPESEDVRKLFEKLTTCERVSEEELNIYNYINIMDAEAKQGRIPDLVAVDPLAFAKLGKVFDKWYAQVYELRNKNEHRFDYGVTCVDGNGRASGEVIIRFEAPADSVKGKLAVAFEELHCIFPGDDTTPERDVPVAEHKDSTDEGQSVYYPSIGTLAQSDNLDNPHQAQIDLSTNIVKFKDAVKYECLLPGVRYSVHGTLMDKETGAAVVDPVTGEEISSVMEFVPESRNGEVVVEFVFDAKAVGIDMTNMDGLVETAKSIVVFEELRLMKAPETPDIPSDVVLSDNPNLIVAEHKDINDEGQSMNVGNFVNSEFVPALAIPLLGDNLLVVAAAMSVFAAIACVMMMIRMKRMR